MWTLCICRLKTRRIPTQPNAKRSKNTEKQNTMSCDPHRPPADGDRVQRSRLNQPGPSAARELVLPDPAAEGIRGFAPLHLITGKVASSLFSGAVSHTGLLEPGILQI